MGLAIMPVYCKCPSCDEVVSPVDNTDFGIEMAREDGLRRGTPKYKKIVNARVSISETQPEYNGRCEYCGAEFWTSSVWHKKAIE
jgi:hypothetical protein